MRNEISAGRTCADAELAAEVTEDHFANRNSLL
jgi:hypothetical protein